MIKTLDAGFSYIIQNDANMIAQGQYFNPLSAVYLFPRGENFDSVRMFETYDEGRKINVQNWRGVHKVCQCRILIGSQKR